MTLEIQNEACEAPSLAWKELGIIRRLFRVRVAWEDRDFAFTLYGKAGSIGQRGENSSLIFLLAFSLDLSHHNSGILEANLESLPRGDLWAVSRSGSCALGSD